MAIASDSNAAALRALAPAAFSVGTCPGRRGPDLYYVFLSNGSVLKVAGNPPPPSPATRGAVAWLLRRPARQATLIGYRIVFD
jgi:hypothetical protein